MVVDQATMDADPGFGGQLVMGGTDEHVGVAGRQGVERRVIGGNNGPTYGSRCKLDGRRLRHVPIATLAMINIVLSI